MVFLQCTEKNGEKNGGTVLREQGMRWAGIGFFLQCTEKNGEKNGGTVLREQGMRGAGIGFFLQCTEKNGEKNGGTVLREQGMRGAGIGFFLQCTEKNGEKNGGTVFGGTRYSVGRYSGLLLYYVNLQQGSVGDGGGGFGNSWTFYSSHGYRCNFTSLTSKQSIKSL